MHASIHTHMHTPMLVYMLALPPCILLRQEVVEIHSDAESVATALEPLSPLPPLPASPSGSVVYEPVSPSVEAVFVPPPGFSGPGYAGFSCAPPGCPPAPLLAPPNFWASDFDHMSLTGLIGLPAPGYAMSDVKPPPPLPEPVPSSLPEPAASVWPAPAHLPPRFMGTIVTLPREEDSLPQSQGGLW